MTFSSLFAKLFLVVALCVVWPAFAEDPARKADANLYQEAMQSITDGRYDEAREALQRLVSQEPEHAGAWLDIAILHCGMGNTAEAEALFNAIESRFSPPTAIRDVIAQQRAGGCTGPKAANFVRLRLGRGSDDNANQGASNPNFSIGSGSSLVNLVLSPEYAPKQDQFTALSAEFTQVLSKGGTLGFAHLQARQYDTFSQFDLSSLVLGVEHPWRLGGWGLRGTGTMGLITVGGSPYQRQAHLQLQLTPPLVLPKGWEFGVVNGWTGVVYPTLTGFDSQLWESRGQLTYQMGSALVQASAGYALDKGTDQRPGNDRSGVVASLTGRTKLAGDVIAELSWSHQSWAGRQAYSPGLIDQHRQQKTQLLRAAVIFPLAPRHALHVEFRNVQNRENISLFEYHARMLQVSWEWRPGS
ncbi:tetratricopeptide repeat protein [Rhodoferax antarcticus]|uniref:tetratricopeptide repeat protein n=1 Tax=Rhodoferax antarcticus TaxID=81479 RepID=UPI0022256D9A|nr:tetratricopeptide repeat protein [Rhodoferax antarcticus]MCW2313987.1 hypothetical protein [Rhodoferax antarcticus]